MDHFTYRDGRLWCEQVAVDTVAAQLGTPVYIYSTATIVHHYRQIVDAFAELSPTICFSIKSCQNLSILKLLKECGAGFDVVSGGELYRAGLVGADPGQLVYAGVGKKDHEIAEAIEFGVRWFNVESEDEMENLIRLVSSRRGVVQAALRVNPDVDPGTHVYTATGKKETKFGVDLKRARRFFDTYGRSEWVKLEGIHLHIGSPVNSVQPYVDFIGKALELIDDLSSSGFAVEMLDIGGGFAANYGTSDSPSAADYAQAIVPLLRQRSLQVVLEPGRSITGNAGILLTEVQYTKQSGDREFIIVDAAMNDLLRPSLYGACHFVWPASVSEAFMPHDRNCRKKQEGTRLVDVVGPVCEIGDFLAKDRYLPPLKRGDLVAVFSAGAYGFVMSSQYNSRPRPPEVLVDGSSHKIVRQRETYQDLVRGEEME